MAMKSLKEKCTQRNSDGVGRGGEEVREHSRGCQVVREHDCERQEVRERGLDCLVDSCHYIQSTV